MVDSFSCWCAHQYNGRTTWCLWIWRKEHTPALLASRGSKPTIVEYFAITRHTMRKDAFKIIYKVYNRYSKAVLGRILSITESIIFRIPQPSLCSQTTATTFDFGIWLISDGFFIDFIDFIWLFQHIHPSHFISTNSIISIGIMLNQFLITLVFCPMRLHSRQWQLKANKFSFAVIATCLYEVKYTKWSKMWSFILLINKAFEVDVLRD